MFSLVEAWGLAPPGKNPCRSVRHYREQPRERFLTREEFQRLGRVLDEAESAGSVWPPAVAAIRLLMLTGCRRSEILTLRWDDVDRSSGELRLRDSKTGARMVPLTSATAEVLAGIPRVPGNPLGDHRPQTRYSPGTPYRPLVPPAGAGRARRRSAS